MLDVKTWLETTGMNVAETSFKISPNLPYIVFLSDEDSKGADDKICIIERDITVELYSDVIKREKEKLLEDLFKKEKINFRKSRIWIDSEKIYQTTYDFSLYEKMEV